MKKIIVVVCVGIIFLTSLFTRLWSINNITYEMAGDALNYHNMANNIIENGVMGYSTSGKAVEPNAYVTPGYPLFLTGVYSLFGDTEEADIHAVKVIQAVLSSLTVLLVFLIGKKIANSFVGILASLCMVIYPTFLIVTVFHLTETLYSFLFFLYLYVHLITFERNIKWMHTLSGFLFALAVMVRPAIFPFFLVIYGYKWIIEREKNIFSKLVFFLLGVLIIMVPWWIRNFVLFGKFIMLCTQAGNPLLGGAYPPQYAPRSYPQKDQLRIAIKVISDGFKNHTKEYIYWFTMGKLKITFEDMYLIGYLPKFQFMKNIHFASIYLGTLGLVMGVFQRKARLLSAYIVMMIGVVMVFIPEQRYAFTIMPLFMILAAYLFYAVIKVLVSWRKVSNTKVKKTEEIKNV